MVRCCGAGIPPGHRQTDNPSRPGRVAQGMKINSHLVLVKGQASAMPGEAGGRRRPAGKAAPAAVTLVVRENRRAGELTTAGLEEARRLLAGLRQALKDQPGAVLATVHQVNHPVLVRLL